MKYTSVIYIYIYLSLSLSLSLYIYIYICLLHSHAKLPGCFFSCLFLSLPIFYKCLTSILPGGASSSQQCLVWGFTNSNTKPPNPIQLRFGKRQTVVETTSKTEPVQLCAQGSVLAFGSQLCLLLVICPIPSQFSCLQVFADLPTAFVTSSHNLVFYQCSIPRAVKTKIKNNMWRVFFPKRDT